MGSRNPKKQAYKSEWICDDRPKPMCPKIAALTDEENEVLFLLLFGKNLPQNEVDQIINSISDTYDGCLDWLKYYRDYFFIDSDSTKIMLKPDAPEEAVISFELFKEANGYDYEHVAKE